MGLLPPNHKVTLLSFTIFQEINLELTKPPEFLIYRRFFKDFLPIRKGIFSGPENWSTLAALNPRALRSEKHHKIIRSVVLV
jgi:hypothetical protein